MYNANLEILQAKEDEINKKYDQRTEALDKIQAANENIKAQNQAQLNLAEALSRGDLSAALKASEEAEALAAQQAVQARKDAMDKARKDEIESLEVNVNGILMKREDIEKKIAAQNEIIREAKAAQYESEIKIGEAAKKNLAAQAAAAKASAAKTKSTSTSTSSGTSSTGVVAKNVGATKKKDTGVVKKTDATGGPANLTTKSANLKAGTQFAADMAKVSDKSLISGGNAAATALQKATTNRNNLTGLARGYKSVSELTSALQKKKITDTEYRKALPVIKEYEAAMAEAVRFGVVRKNSTNIAGNLLSWKNNTDEAKVATVKNIGTAYQEGLEETAANLPGEIRAVLDWIKNRATLSGPELKDLKAKRQKLGTVSVQKLRAYLALPEKKKKQDDLYKTYIANGVFTEADIKAWDAADRIVETNALKANEYRKQLATLGYTSANMSWYFDKNDKDALRTRIHPEKNQGFSKVAGYAKGGYVMPKGFFEGGYAMGTDTIPAMLTPGEFIVSQPAVKNFGVDSLKAINNGTYGGESVYNYSINVSVQSGANPDEIARAVMTQIQNVDSQRVRGNRF
jgi:hypothetical protein